MAQAITFRALGASEKTLAFRQLLFLFAAHCFCSYLLLARAVMRMKTRVELVLSRLAQEV